MPRTNPRRQASHVTRRRLLNLFVIFGLNVAAADSAFAQISPAAADRLRRQLKPGDFISIVQTTGDSVAGRLLRFGDTDIEIRAEIRQPAGQRRRLDVKIPHEVIRSLERPRDSSRNGALIGAGIGAGFSTGLFVYAAAVDYNEIDEWAPIYVKMGAVFTGLGALIGWAIDSAHSKPPVTFHASSTGSSIMRARGFASRGASMALVVSF